MNEIDWPEQQLWQLVLQEQHGLLLGRPEQDGLPKVQPDVNLIKEVIFKVLNSNMNNNLSLKFS